MIFLTVLAVIVLILLFLGFVMWPIIVWTSLDIWCLEWSTRTRVLHTVGSILGLTLVITIFASTVAQSDNSTHCGPGTVYRESSHYNAATKTVETDWVCEAR